jgi:hypothetical protein
MDIFGDEWDQSRVERTSIETMLPTSPGRRSLWTAD